MQIRPFLTVSLTLFPSLSYCRTEIIRRQVTADEVEQAEEVEEIVPVEMKSRMATPKEITIPLLPFQVL